jgi:cupin superfamily acireductone dioxygenase involved in methionine salvage
MPSLDQRKQQIWERLESNLDNYFAQVRTQAQEAIETYKQHSITALDNRIDSYINSYKEAVSNLLDEQKTELKRLSDLQEFIQKDLLEVNKRQVMLKSEREKFIKISIS